MESKGQELISDGGHVEFEWYSVDEGDERDGGYRPYVVAIVILAGVAALLALFATPTVAHASLTADDVTLTGDSGQLKELVVAPNGSVHYDGLEQAPSSVDVTIEVNDGTGWYTVGSQSVSASGREGNVSYSFSDTDVLGPISLKNNDFKAQDGQSSSTTLELRVTATLVGAGANGNDVTATATDGFTVTVTNEPAGGAVHGKGNTNGNAN